MVLIIGGASQGKTTCAKTRFGFSDGEILDGALCDSDAVFSAKCIDRYHLLVKHLLETGADAVSFTKKLCEKNPSAVILMNEIGCGIIPMERNDRLWRETAGRCGCILAAQSHTVLRVFCGIATVLKEEEHHG